MGSTQPNSNIRSRKISYRFTLPAFKCQVCGAYRSGDSLKHDPRFWVQSATYPELLTGSKTCLWCDVLMTGVQICTGKSEEVLHETGYLDWGINAFCPVWHAGGERIDIEILCTHGRYQTPI
jgi:hypothetical protein